MEELYQIWRLGCCRRKSTAKSVWSGSGTSASEYRLENHENTSLALIRERYTPHYAVLLVGDVLSFTEILRIASSWSNP